MNTIRIFRVDVEMEKIPALQVVPERSELTQETKRT
jgi:hypothetical protein